MPHWCRYQVVLRKQHDEDKRNRGVKVACAMEYNLHGMRFDKIFVFTEHSGNEFEMERYHLWKYGYLPQKLVSGGKLIELVSDHAGQHRLYHQ